MPLPEIKASIDSTFFIGLARYRDAPHNFVLVGCIDPETQKTHILSAIGKGGSDDCLLTTCARIRCKDPQDYRSFYQKEAGLKKHFPHQNKDSGWMFNEPCFTKIFLKNLDYKAYKISFEAYQTYIEKIKLLRQTSWYSRKGKNSPNFYNASVIDQNYIFSLNQENDSIDLAQRDSLVWEKNLRDYTQLRYFSANCRATASDLLRHVGIEDSAIGKNNYFGYLPHKMRTYDQCVLGDIVLHEQDSKNKKKYRPIKNENSCLEDKYKLALLRFQLIKNPLNQPHFSNLQKEIERLHRKHKSETALLILVLDQTSSLLENYNNDDYKNYQALVRSIKRGTRFAKLAGFMLMTLSTLLIVSTGFTALASQNIRGLMTRGVGLFTQPSFKTLTKEMTKLEKNIFDDARNTAQPYANLNNV